MKKWFCLLMAALLCFSVLPAGALAEDGGELSLVPGGLVMQEETELPETPAETEAPEETEAPAETEETEATEAPEETEEPEVTEAPAETEETEATEVPEEIEAPEATEVPEEPEEPEAPEEAETPAEEAGEEVSEPATDGASGTWLWPVASSRVISSNFGMRDLNNDGTKEAFHSGIDISASVGTQVRATKSGTVIQYCNSYGAEEKVWSEDMTSYGNYVAIKHDDGTYSLYAHLSPNGMKTSGYVNQGDVIALSGNSGYSLAPHLHFQATYNPYSSGWSGAANLINTMPTESTISKYGITVNNGYQAASGYSTQRMEYIFDVAGNSYINQCTEYPTYLDVEISNATTLKKYPCSAGTDASSTDIYTPSIGTRYTAYALWKNTAGKYWYEVKHDGETCYLFAGDAEVTKHRTDDVTISGVRAPTALSVGDRFSIQGEISSSYNIMSTVQGYIFAGQVENLASATSDSLYKVHKEPWVTSYSLLNSDVDLGLLFNKLSEGHYTYMINVVCPNYYSADGSTLQTWWPGKEIVVQYFTVGDPEPVGYTVSFNANGGNCSTSSKTVTYGSTYGTLPTPTRSYYNFAGWYTAASGGTKVTASSTVSITANQTLYAHWTGKSYTISFNANGGSCDTSSKTVTYGSTYGTLPTPTRTGYTFVGWFNSRNGGEEITASSEVSLPATIGETLYAHWTVTSRMPGDVTGDGKVNTADVLRLLKYVNGQAVSLGEGSGDTTGDGKVNTADVLRLLKYVNGQSVSIY